ncbi:hypothetical protein VaNZ11_003287 [Volvox africanus]|uniref:Protease Do-like PDZ domain-containing protein n=1 Tax=Volvox africanus TaxID=51714 RepID=A0ABQ5RUY6_9CHLO|nr:hypothetical protein VaNZ11_003287 [Volvox africanus]
MAYMAEHVGHFRLNNAPVVRPSACPRKSPSQAEVLLTSLAAIRHRAGADSCTGVPRASMTGRSDAAVSAVSCKCPSNNFLWSPRRLTDRSRLCANAGHRAGRGGGRSSPGKGDNGGAITQESVRIPDDSSMPAGGRPEFFPAAGAADIIAEATFRWSDAVPDDQVDDESEEGADEEEEEEEGEEGEEVAILARSVVQIHTLHRVPNFSRPWEEGHDAESRSSGFVVAVDVVSEPGGPPQRQLLIMTTAGAVEFARKVEVCRAADDATPYVATVAAVCLDLDVALLRVEKPSFWQPNRDDGSSSSSSGSPNAAENRRQRGRGREVLNKDNGDHDDDDHDDDGSSSRALVPLQLDSGLPHLRKPVVVTGFPLGGGSLCVTSGVLSRIEVVEYSHSGRSLLALQVDAPLNNGGWGGPALCPRTRRCVGMAFQKFTWQAWMERYDDVASEVFQGDGDEDGGGGGGGGGGSADGDEGDDGDGGGGGAPGQEYDEDAENIGYLVPAQLLQLVLDDYSRQMSNQLASTSAPGTSTSVTATAVRRSSSSSSSSSGGGRGAKRGGSAATSTAGAGSDPRIPGSMALHLDGRPRLGLRYQRMESPALRRALGLMAGESGILITGVDPTGSAAGLVQVHDVLLAVAGRQVANDGTTLLRPGQRVLFGHWAAVANVGDELQLRVLRGKTRLELRARLRGSFDSFLPVSFGPSQRPQYLVVGPLVFISFSVPLWYEMTWGQRRVTDPASRRAVHAGMLPVMAAMEWGLPAEDDGEEVVMLTEVLACGEDVDEGTAEDDEEHQDSGRSTDANSNSSSSSSSSGTALGRGGVAQEVAAWSRLLRSPGRLATVNGQRVRNMGQLAAAVVAASQAAATSAGGGEQQFLRFCMEPAPENYMSGSSRSSSSSSTGSADGDVATAAVSEHPAPQRCVGGLLVLDAARVAADTRAVLKHHSLAAAMSADLRRRLSTQWPFELSHPAGGASRQRRQQGRRVAISGRRSVCRPGAGVDSHARKDDDEERQQVQGGVTTREREI